MTSLLIDDITQLLCWVISSAFRNAAMSTVFHSNSRPHSAAFRSVPSVSIDLNRSVKVLLAQYEPPLDCSLNMFSDNEHLGCELQTDTVVLADEAIVLNVLSTPKLCSALNVFAMLNVFATLKVFTALNGFLMLNGTPDTIYHSLTFCYW